METIVSILVPATFVVLLVLERLAPGRPLPRVRRWLPKGILFFLLVGALNAVLPAVIVGATAPYAPFNLSGLGTLGGAAVAVLVGDLFAYWLHRLQHNVPFIWRWSHQMHHSAERLDVAGAFYFHPFDVGVVIVVTTAATSLLGVTPNAAALAGFLGFFFAVFQHLNVRTPRWLGYVIQRPEAHAVHHGRGIHAYNYGNLSVWDLVFGTFRNPATFSGETGFWNGASARIVPMLLGRDVGQPPAARASSSSSVAA
jgi:sterol desaturase/sphingolipid hydroxylase (fatty acid hydroxylase superfamily)